VTAPTRWAIDPSLPIYEQIWRTLAGAIARGEIAPGEALPSVRDLAVQLGVNVNTVQKAYRTLESARLAQSRPGQGTFAQADAAAIARHRERQIDESVARLLEDLETWGVGADAAADTVARFVRNGGSTGGTAR